jgi:hypothetical protein
MTDDAKEKLDDLRQRVLTGEKPTKEDYARLVEALREGRNSFTGEGKTAKGKKAVTPLNPHDLFTDKPSG